MIRQIIKKDWTLLWPVVALVTAIQIALICAVFNVASSAASPVAVELFGPLSVAWFLGIAVLAVAVVQQEAVPGDDQDWLIRPLKRRDVLAAKILFVLATVSVPMFVLDMALALASGFPAAYTAPVLLYKEIYVFVFLIVPLLAFAASTRNMSELTLMVGALLVAYAASSGASALLLGDRRCPTCGTGFVWMEHLLQHTVILCGAVVILVLQYRGRRTDLSRGLALLGAAALAFVQLPWDISFAIERRVDLPRAPAAVAIESATVIQPGAGSESPQAFLVPQTGRQATRAILRGHVEEAVQYLRHRPSERLLEVVVSERVSGVAADELLLVDRLDVRLEAAEGDLLYHARNLDAPPNSLSGSAGDLAAASGLVRQIIRIPAATLDDSRVRSRPVLQPSSADRPMKLRMTYWLTLVKVEDQYQMAAIDGEFRAPEMGLCRARLEGDVIAVRCSGIGRAPFCYAATLYGPDGSHNPEITKCEPDYRPYLPAFANVLSYAGLELPVRDRYGLAHYAVDASRLNRCHVLFKLYGIREHLKRTLVSAPFSIKAG